MPAEASVSKAEATMGYGASVHLEGDSLDDCVLLAEARPASPVFTSSIPSTTRRSWRDRARSVSSSSRTSTTSPWSSCPSAAAGSSRASPAPSTRSLPRYKSSPSKPPSAPRSLPGAGVPGHASKPARLSPTASRSNDRAASPSASSSGHVDKIVGVGENEIADAMVMLLTRSKLLVEGAGAVGAAALMAGLISRRLRDDRRGALGRQRRHRPSRPGDPAPGDQRRSEGRPLRPHP